MKKENGRGEKSKRRIAIYGVRIVRVPVPHTSYRWYNFFIRFIGIRLHAIVRNDRSRNITV
jgi:hypothetical protein